MLYLVVLVLTRKFKIALPNRLKWGISGWKGVGTIESEEVKLVLDVSVPTDCDKA